MSIAVNLALTTKGQALKAKIETGLGTIPLSITRIVTASGTSDDPLNLTAVVNERQEFTITGRTTQDARTTISTVLTNVGLAQGYSLSQIGFYAIDPDEGEILYRISQFAEPNYVPAPTERGWTYSPTFNIVTGNASDVVVSINPEGVATTKAIWDSVEYSDRPTPSVGVKTQYFTVKNIPNYRPALPPEPEPGEPQDGFMQLEDGTTASGAIRLDNGQTAELLVTPLLP